MNGYRAALASKQVPEGWKLVPVDLTPEMVKADPYGMGYGRLHVIWNRLLAAVPERPQAIPGKCIDSPTTPCQYIDGLGRKDCDLCNPQPQAGQSAVEKARGFVAFGAGAYRIQQTQEPGLVVTFRRDGEQAYAVGDRAGEVDQAPIPAEDIIVRLQFTSAEGLDSLEAHLREIRAEHWAKSAQPPAPPALVPLTVPEIHALWKRSDARADWSPIEDFARAIEARYGIGTAKPAQPEGGDRG